MAVHTGSGKTTWAAQYMADNPSKRYLLLGTNMIMRQMRVRENTKLLCELFLLLEAPAKNELIIMRFTAPVGHMFRSISIVLFQGLMIQHVASDPALGDAGIHTLCTVWH